MKLACAALSVAALLAAAQSARAQTVWSGGAGTDRNWSTANNWVGAVVPVNGAVLFTNSEAVVTASNINNIVDAAFITQGGIASLQYSQTNANHTTLIAAGQTLAISSGLSAGTETDEGVNQSQLLATITGPGAAINLAGGNLQAHQGSGTAGNHRFTLDLSGLDTLNATVGRLLVGVANSSAATQNRPSGALNLAKTNIITASGAVPALDVGDTGSAGNNGNVSILLLGQTNALFVNGVASARLKSQFASLRFNPLFTANNGNPTAFFRASDASSRVPSWAIADGIGNSGGTTTPSATNDFSGGTVDALVDTLTLGKTSTAGTPGGRPAVGILTLSAGTFDVNSVTNGWQTQSGNDVGVGIINVNGTATLIVNTVLEMGRVNGAAVTNSRGVLNLNGGSARIAALSAALGSTNNTISINGGSLVLTNATLDASAGPGIRNFSITNAALTLNVQTLAPSLQLTGLAVGDPTNKINLASIPVVGGYPTVFTLIKYSSWSGATNIGLGTLPPNLTPYAGYISNDFANNAIDFVVTAGPAPARDITWSGSPNGTWDVASTANWKDTNGNPTIFNQTDFVRFDDSALGPTTVNLSTQLDPTSITVSNQSLVYVFQGTGFLDGSVGILKQGPGELFIDNSSPNTFSGGIDIEAGTLVFGNNDANANLPPSGSIANNGILAFSQNSDLTVNNTISGSGNIVQSGFGSGILRLAAANSFSGSVSVSAGTLVPANNSALGTTNGSTIINPGATLDLQGPAGGAANALNLGLEPFFVSGSGIGGNGAIVNNGSVSQQNAIRSVSLVGNTTFGGASRWDIRGAGANLSTGGNPFSITKIGVNQVSLVGVNPVDPALGDINVQQGIFAVQLATAGLGDPTKTLAVSPGATLDLYNLSTPINKQIVLNGDGSVVPGILFAENGNSTLLGAMTLNGACTFNVGGVSLTLSNALAGPGTIYKNGGGGLLLSGTVSVGGTITNAVGALAINGVVNTPVLSLNAASLFGYGTNTASVDVQGTLNPGSSNAPGAFAATAGLILESGASLTFDLGTNNASDPAVNDIINVTGDLATTNAQIFINQYQGRLQAGSYRLINYSGNLLGDAGLYFGSPQPVGGVTRYTFALDTSTPHQVNLIVSGSSADLKWAALAANGSSAWDVVGSLNWLNGSTPDLFYNGDTVTLDDSVPGVTNTLTIGAGIVVQPAAITVNSSANNYAIAGPGKITGATGITKSGPSTLTITSTNDFTGPVSVLAGTLKVGSNPALGATNSGTTIASGATLDLGGGNLAANALNLGFENVTVSGAGVGGLGVIVSSNTNAQQNALRTVTLAGDTTLGGVSAAYWIGNVGRWDIRSQAANTDIASPTNAFLSTGGNPYNLTKTGSNLVCLVGLAVDPALANINILQGAMSFEHSTTLGDPAQTLTVTNGATMQIWQTWPSNLLNKVLVLYGDGVNTNVYSPSGNNIFVGPITLNSGVQNSNCVFSIQGATLTLSNNTISGSAGLNKVGSGSLIIYDDCPYFGSTFVSAGTLALAGTAHLTSTPSLTIAGGATLDVSARSDSTLTLQQGGRSLSGNGTILGSLVVSGDTDVSPGINGPGTLTVTNAITIFGQTFMDLAANTNDLLKAGTSITFEPFSSLQLTFTPGTLTNGQSFKLFSAPAYSGSFGGLNPPTPGTGLAWNTSLLYVSGILSVQRTVATYPTNITAVVSSGSLSLSWPTDHLGWWLQVQTNAPGLGLGTNWLTIPGSSATTSAALPLDPANGSVFCRLVYTNAP
ncbi:MAG TPA: autotransporter-associated beta strand repeat-containing protein [Candidatus Acidoferrum sp.]|jgi:fibronectin-binding autotransporter adhesin|nr:autotransporter-associated beta strand repeat-containing protein [Candidatus Acidoferrum sp.]